MKIQSIFVLDLLVFFRTTPSSLGKLGSNLLWKAVPMAGIMKSCQRMTACESTATRFFDPSPYLDVSENMGKTNSSSLAEHANIHCSANLSLVKKTCSQAEHRCFFHV